MLMLQKTPLSVAISTALGLAAGGLAPFVANAADPLDSEVVVTGSRITRATGYENVSPVSVISTADIKATGLTRLEDVLNSLPQVEAAQNSFISNGSTGTASLDLRGLGSARTLVLFNGKRMQPGGVWTEAPDINQIPAAIVERVEVLTGGASATYGADAVAGVVNFITRRVNGIEISAGTGGYQHDNSNSYLPSRMDAEGFSYPTGDSGIGGVSNNIDLVIGSDFPDGRGNATVYATYRQSDALLQAKRDYSSCALNAEATECGGSGSAPIPNFIIAPIVSGAPDFDDIDYFTLGSNSGLIPWTTNYYNYAPVNYFMRPEDRYSAGAFVDYQVNEHFTPYLELNYTSTHTAAQIAESGTFFAAGYTLPVNHFLFPAAFRSSLATRYPGATDVVMYIGKRNVEGGPRTDVLDHDSFRIVLGSKGQLVGNWDYDMYYQRAETQSSTTYINDLSLPAIEAAISTGCQSVPGGCYQVFTYNGVTPEQAAGLGRTAIATGTTALEVASAYVSGDFGVSLPGASPIQLAAGLNYGRTEYERIADSIYQEGSLAGQGGPTPNLAGAINVIEFFSEASIPLVEDKSFAQSLSLDLAYRYSDYSTSGNTNTYRFGIDWRPVDMLRLRTGFNRAVRAPSVGELFAVRQIGLWSGTDPCSTATPIYTAAQCARTGVTAAQYGNIARSPAGQYYQRFGGNPDLKPETADTITFGIVVEPMENLTFSIDYWQIKIEDTISELGPALILEQCGLFNEFCSFINRSGSGSLWLGSGLPTGHVENRTQNFGENTWEGIDLAANYRIDAAGGIFNVGLTGTSLLTREVAPVPARSSITYDCKGVISEKCFPAPDWRHTLSVGYDSNESWSVMSRWRYFSGVSYDGTTDTLVESTTGSQSYFDLSAAFKFFENSEIIIGINNVLDEEPPMMGDTLNTNANTIAGFWDTLGRYVFTSATFRF